MEQEQPTRKIRLYDYDGDSIGYVAEVNPDFIVVEGHSGLLGLGGRRVYFLPRAIVTREEPGRWYTSVPKEEIDRNEWRAAPASSAFASDWTEGGEGLERLGVGEGTVVRAYEEELDVHTTVHQAGEVVITKQVVEEVRTIEVPVRREVIHVERRPVSGDSAALSGPASDSAFASETIRVPVMEEQIEVRKVPVVVEEVQITKTTTEEKRRVEETVRREQVDVDDTSLRSPTDPS